MKDSLLLDINEGRYIDTEYVVQRPSNDRYGSLLAKQASLELHLHVSLPMVERRDEARAIQGLSSESGWVSSSTFSQQGC